MKHLQKQAPQRDAIPAMRGWANFGFWESLVSGLLPRDLHFRKLLSSSFMLSSYRHYNVATNRLRETRSQNNVQSRPTISNSGICWGTVPNREEDLSGTVMYHRAKYYADR